MAGSSWPTLVRLPGSRYTATSTGFSRWSEHLAAFRRRGSVARERSEHTPVVDLQHLGGHAGVQLGEARAHTCEMAQAHEHPASDSGRVVVMRREGHSRSAAAVAAARAGAALP